jgi:Meckelin (Transmembrane protein 67)
VCVSDIDIAALPSTIIPQVASVNLAALVSYETGAQIYSAVITYYYLKSAVGCANYLDIQSCQSLANQCVFQNYNPAAVAC